MIKSGFRDVFKHYQNNVSKPIELSVFLRILKAQSLFFIYKVMQGQMISLPCGLGTMHIDSKKSKAKFNEEGKLVGGFPIDWKSTKELWGRCEESRKNKKKVYFLNDHSNGYRYKFYWCKKHVLIPGKSLYNFTPSRSNKRLLAKLIKSGKEY